MLTLKLTPGQRSAVEIYVTDPAHAEDYPEATLQRRDPGAVKALDNVLVKLRKLRA